MENRSLIDFYFLGLQAENKGAVICKRIMLQMCYCLNFANNIIPVYKGEKETQERHTYRSPGCSLEINEFIGRPQNKPLRGNKLGEYEVVLLIDSWPPTPLFHIE